MKNVIIHILCLAICAFAIVIEIISSAVLNDFMGITLDKTDMAFVFAFTSLYFERRTRGLLW